MESPALLVKADKSLLLLKCTNAEIKRGGGGGGQLMRCTNDEIKRGGGGGGGS